MATAMVTLTWCDIHLTDHNEEVPGHPFTWDDLQVDLCEQCLPTIAAARIIFEKYGSKGPRTMPVDGLRKRRPDQQPVALPCPAEGCASVLSSRSSLGAHARQTHGVTLGELEGKPLAFTCEECGRGFTTYQGIALHQRAHEREKAAAAPTVKRSGAKRAPAAQSKVAP